MREAVSRSPLPAPLVAGRLTLPRGQVRIAAVPFHLIPRRAPGGERLLEAAIGPTAMKTVTGFEVENPRELLLGFVHHWYPLYDGVEVAEDSELRVSEIALSTMLNSRISGNTGGAIWREARLEVSEALRSVRVGMDLLDMLPTDLAPDEPGISRAITAICNVHRSKLAVATKILHKKRPGLIAIFDSVVEGHYHPRWCPTVTARSWGDYAVALTRLVHKDMLSIDAELQNCVAW